MHVVHKHESMDPPACSIHVWQSSLWMAFGLKRSCPAESGARRCAVALQHPGVVVEVLGGRLLSCCRCVSPEQEEEAAKTLGG